MNNETSSRFYIEPGFAGEQELFMKEVYLESATFEHELLCARDNLCCFLEFSDESVIGRIIAFIKEQFEKLREMIDLLRFKYQHRKGEAMKNAIDAKDQTFESTLSRIMKMYDTYLSLAAKLFDGVVSGKKKDTTSLLERENIKLLNNISASFEVTYKKIVRPRVEYDKHISYENLATKYMDHIKEETKKIERSMDVSVKRLREAESESYSSAMKIVTSVNKTSSKICTMILDACSKAEVQVNFKGSISGMITKHKQATDLKRSGEYQLDEYKLKEYQLNEYEPDEYQLDEYKLNKYKLAKYKPIKYKPVKYKPTKYAPTKYKPTKYKLNKYAAAEYKPAEYE